MRTAARTDQNQAKLVSQLRALGVSVACLHRLGGGVPALLIGHRHRNYLVEVKDPDQPPSGRVLTSSECTWHSRWTGQVSVAESLDDVLRTIGDTGDGVEA